MFDTIRNHQRLTMAFMLLLIVPAFVMFGIDGYSRFTSAGQETVAKVAGSNISRAEWEAAHERLMQNTRRQNAGDTSQVNSPAARLETLDSLVAERVLKAAALDQHLAPNAVRLQRLFDADPRYQGWRGGDGRINRDILLANGLSPEGLDQYLRQEYAQRQVLAGVAMSGYTPASVAAHSLDALLQGREVQLQRFEALAYRAKVAPTDADVQAFYKANEAAFKAPEQAKIEWVMLDLDALGRGETITEEEARKFYDDKTTGAKFADAPEERRASHILIKADGAASQADKDKAKAKAQALLEQVRKAPASFAEIARKASEDKGSAEQGGDLDFNRRGAMVKPFDDAMFALKSGEISELVLSEYGYHIIQLTGQRGGVKKPFDAVKADIVAELRRSAAMKKWPKAAEEFNDQAYQNSDTLQGLVDKYKLEKKSGTMLRAGTPGAAGPLASAKLREAVFAGDAIRNKRNTDAIEVAPQQLVVARVVEHKPARLMALEEVKDDARNRVALQQAAALARKDGEARLAEVQKAPGSGLPISLLISRADSQGAPEALVEAVMKADPAKLPYIAGVDLGEAGYAVLRVSAIKPRPAPPGGGADPLVQQVSQLWTAAETEAYLEALKRRYKVDIKPAAKAAAAAAAASSAGN